MANTSMNMQQDIYFMSLAIAEAKKGVYTTRPNPAVGCVIVKNGELIATGFHVKAGGPHAEVVALQSAKNHGIDVKGGTVYVTLEPCSHYGKTPPCAQGLIEAGVSRVVVADLDPNPQVSGRGVASLEAAGIQVSTGVMPTKAHHLNRGFLKAMRFGKPYVRLKIATSLDGRTAMASGESKWITGTQSREDVQKIRAVSGAIITGSQTIIDDNPSLNVRSAQLGVDINDIVQPKIVVLDRRKRLLSLKHQYQALKKESTLIWTQDSLQDLLTDLVDKHQIYDVLVEAGSSVAGDFMASNLVDELIVYQAPCVLGRLAKPMLNIDIDTLSNQHRLQLLDHQQMGEDIKLTYQANHVY